MAREINWSGITCENDESFAILRDKNFVYVKNSTMRFSNQGLLRWKSQTMVSLGNKTITHLTVNYTKKEFIIIIMNISSSNSKQCNNTLLWLSGIKIQLYIKKAWGLVIQKTRFFILFSQRRIQNLVKHLR